VRVVAPDYGSARCGVAVSDLAGRFSEDFRAGRPY
jgi:RNase H-fold protein (predicted Holliday junction resolvase)